MYFSYIFFAGAVGTASIHATSIEDYSYQQRAAITAAPAINARGPIVDPAYVHEARMTRKFGVHPREVSSLFPVTQIEDGQLQVPAPKMASGVQSIPASCTTIVPVPVIMASIGGVAAIIPAPANHSVAPQLVCLANIEESPSSGASATKSSEDVSYDSTVVVWVTAGIESTSLPGNSTTTPTASGTETASTASTTSVTPLTTANFSSTVAAPRANFRSPGTSEGVQLKGAIFIVMLAGSITATLML